MAIERHVCDQCGDATTGDALGAPCLHGLQQAAHAAPPPDPADAETVIRDWLRRHLTRQPMCPRCPTRAAAVELAMALLQSRQLAEQLGRELDAARDRIAQLEGAQASPRNPLAAFLGAR